MQNGLQNKTINNNRSAISAFHNQIQGKPVGDHPRIYSLAAGIFNRTSTTKVLFYLEYSDGDWFCEIWMAKEWGSSGQIFAYKLTMALALTSAHRVLSSQHLDIRFMTKGTNNYMFTFGNFHKAWWIGKPPPSLRVYTFEEDTKLCIVATFEEYLKRTKVWCGKDKS